MTVVLPDLVPVIEDMEADVAASSVTDFLRAVATSTSDVSSWTAAQGAPANWTGAASEAASHAMTQFGGATDIVSTALTHASLACGTYVRTLTALTRQHLGLVQDRFDVNQDISDLLDRATGASEDLAPELQGQADELRVRVNALEARIVAWQHRVLDNEDLLIAAFRAADSVGEAQRLRQDPARPDVQALNRRLEQIKGDPQAVNAWWTSLSPAERETLKIDNPDLVGNVDGIPVDDRDDANRTSLTRDLDFLKNLKKHGELSGKQQTLLKHAEAAQDALDRGLTLTDPATGLPVDTNLMLYVPGAFLGDGAVAVTYGNPDTADNTSVVVPGIMNDMSAIDGNAGSAVDLFNQANELAPGSSNATIAWIGYNAPDFNPAGLSGVPLGLADIGMVTNEQFAEAGGQHLSDFVGGLRATDTGADSHLTVIGHSYGSTTVAHAAHDGLAADNLVLLGSPGAGGDADGVGDLHMPAGSVFVGARDHDFVTWLGRDGHVGLGPDPSQQSFGAQRIDVGTGEDFHVADIGGQGLANHTSYFDKDSTSLRNIADVTTGKAPDLIAGRTEPANDYARDFAGREAYYYADQAFHAVADPVLDTTVGVVGGVIDTGGRLIDTGGRIVDGVGHVLEGAGRFLTPPIPHFGGMWPR